MYGPEIRLSNLISSNVIICELAIRRRFVQEVIGFCFKERKIS